MPSVRSTEQEVKMKKTVTLYSNKSDYRYVNKELIPVGTFECTIKDDCSIDSPTIILKSISDELLARTNYMHIKEWDRYYYTSAPIVSTGGIIEVDGTIDYLMTFKDDIYNADGYIARQENVYNPYIEDNMIQMRDTKIVRAFDLGLCGDENLSTYITCIGGRGEVEI